VFGLTISLSETLSEKLTKFVTSPIVFFGELGLTSFPLNFSSGTTVGRNSKGNWLIQVYQGDVKDYKVSDMYDIIVTFINVINNGVKLSRCTLV